MMNRYGVAPGVVLIATVLAACTAQVVEDAEVGATGQALASDVRSFRNFAGDLRYVKENANEVKLLFDPNGSNPKSGFRNSNHFSNSCGPTAAVNVFKWYGIDELEGDYCYWHYESSADTEGANVPPIWVCRPRITAQNLGYQMETNTWRMASFTMPGTSTGNFRKVFYKYVDRWMPNDVEYQYRYEEGDGYTQYHRIWETLSQGHPVVVNYKTGTTKGHFATIVGIEKVGSASYLGDDKIYLANPRKEDLSNAISWSTFRTLWRRDYNDFGALQLVGERRYTRINLWDVGATEPGTGGGGGGGGNLPDDPIHMK